MGPRYWLAALSVIAATPQPPLHAQEVQPTASPNADAQVVAPAEKAEKTKSEWQLKPRWRVQYDIAEIDGPTGLAGTGSFNDIRRTQLGIDIKMPHALLIQAERVIE